MLCKRTYKLLIVDDEKGLCNELKALLEEQGYVVLTAHNGHEALELLKQEEVHALVSDVYMPVMDGLDLLVQARRNYPDLKLLAFSGGDRTESVKMSNDSILKAIEKFGQIEVLRKPMRAEFLLERVSSLLKEA